MEIRPGDLRLIIKRQAGFFGELLVTTESSPESDIAAENFKILDNPENSEALAVAKAIYARVQELEDRDPDLLADLLSADRSLIIDINKKEKI